MNKLTYSSQCWDRLLNRLCKQLLSLVKYNIRNIPTNNLKYMFLYVQALFKVVFSFGTRRSMSVNITELGLSVVLRALRDDNKYGYLTLRFTRIIFSYAYFICIFHMQQLRNAIPPQKDCNLQTFPVFFYASIIIHKNRKFWFTA